MDGRARDILLNFDLEEFDIPLEYGAAIPESEQMAVSAQGLERLAALLDSRGARATLFCTASFAQANTAALRTLAETHEAASHGLDHRQVAPDGPARSKAVLESLLGRPVLGFRSPRLQRMDSRSLADAGYSYDSSENPVWLPGRYNNLGRPRTAYIESGVLCVPASATPLARLPLFWLTFKNAPLPLVTLLSAWTLRTDGYLNVYFHPWEFADIAAYPLPFHVRRHCGMAMRDRLARYMDALAPHGRFSTFSEFDAAFRARPRAGGTPPPPRGLKST